MNQTKRVRLISLGTDLTCPLEVAVAKLVPPLTEGTVIRTKVDDREGDEVIEVQWDNAQRLGLSKALGDCWIEIQCNSLMN